MKQGTRSQRILLVAPSPPPSGGMALQARQLERLLQSDGIAVDFFASNFVMPFGLQFLEQVPGARTVARAALIWPRLWRPIERADVVHVLAASWLYFFVVVYPAVILGRVRGKRVVLNYRGGEAEPFFRLFGWLAKPAFRLASVITAPSGFLSEAIRARFRMPVSIVSNVLDTSIFRYRHRTVIRPRMLVTRQLEKIYDIESVLRAFGAVQKDHPDATLWIAGTGSQASHLRTLVETWNLKNVSFLGQVKHTELPEIYDQCDIYLNASRVDNFPAGLLEASASGLVVVSTAPGGIPFMYRDGKEALLVEAGDWQGLARSVQRVLTDSTLAGALTKAAVALAQQCEWREARKSIYQAYGVSFEMPAMGDRIKESVQCGGG